MRALFLFFETVWAKEKDDYKKAPGKVGRLLYRVCPSVSIVYCGRPKRRVQLSKSSVPNSPDCKTAWSYSFWSSVVTISCLET